MDPSGQYNDSEQSPGEYILGDEDRVIVQSAKELLWKITRSQMMTSRRGNSLVPNTFLKF